MPRRQKFERTTWLEQIAALKAKLEETPHGKERDEVARQLRQLETAARMSEWLTSPGLQKPT